MVTARHGTWEPLSLSPTTSGMGQPAADETAVGRSGRSTVSVGKPRTTGSTAVGSEVSRIV